MRTRTRTIITILASILAACHVYDENPPCPTTSTVETVSTSRGGAGGARAEPDATSLDPCPSPPTDCAYFDACQSIGAPCQPVGSGSSNDCQAGEWCAPCVAGETCDSGECVAQAGPGETCWLYFPESCVVGYYCSLVSGECEPLPRTDCEP